MKLKILYLVHSIPKYEKSGTPYAAWRVATKLKENNNNIEIGFIIPTPDGSVGKEYEEDVPIYKVKRIDFHENFFHDYNCKRNDFMDELQKIVEDFKPDILHVYNFVFSSYQVLNLKKENKNLKIIRSFTHAEDICFCVDPMIDFGDKIKFCDGPQPTIKCAKHYEMIYGACDYQNVTKSLGKHLMYVEDLHNKYVDKIIFTTDSFKDHIKKYFNLSENKIAVVPHGIDKYNIVNDEFCVNKKLCFIGGTNERKGLGMLIDAIDKQPSILKSFNIDIIGQLIENENYIKLKKLKKKYSNRINILGVVDEQTKIETMKQSDLVILPTYFETYNLVLREVLSFGTPVITTYTFGSDIIKDGENGFRVKIGDYTKLSELLYNIVNDEVIIKNLKEGAKKTYIDTLEDECNKLFNIYTNK